VENQRPKAPAALTLRSDGARPRFPQLVHCSVSAFGRAEAFADVPGFDPIFQSLNGIAVAQGGAHAGRARDLPITIRWTWLVPSTICSTLASRISRSAGKSSTYP